MPRAAAKSCAGLAHVRCWACHCCTGDGRLAPLPWDEWETGGFDGAQIDLVRSFAEQAVIAIITAATHRELQARTEALAQRNTEFDERIEHQAATIDVLKAMLASPGDPQPVFDLIVQRARTSATLTAHVYEFDGTLSPPSCGDWTQRRPYSSGSSRSSVPDDNHARVPAGRAILDVGSSVSMIWGQNRTEPRHRDLTVQIDGAQSL